MFHSKRTHLKVYDDERKTTKYKQDKLNKFKVLSCPKYNRYNSGKYSNLLLMAKHKPLHLLILVKVKAGSQDKFSDFYSNSKKLLTQINISMS